MGQARDLLDRNLKAWNEHQLEAWTDNFSDQARLVGPGGVSGQGPEMTKAFYAIWQDGFPDNQVTNVRSIEEGDRVVLEAVFEGTHTGPLRAPSGEIAPTGKRVSIPFVVTFTCRDDRFTDFRLYFDQMDLITQLGIAPAPAG